jgi:hypothetical protein
VTIDGDEVQVTGKALRHHYSSLLSCMPLRGALLVFGSALLAAHSLR